MKVMAANRQLAVDKAHNRSKERGHLNIGGHIVAVRKNMSKMQINPTKMFFCVV